MDDFDVCDVFDWVVCLKVVFVIDEGCCYWYVVLK